MNSHKSQIAQKKRRFYTSLYAIVYKWNETNKKKIRENYWIVEETLNFSAIIEIMFYTHILQS